MQSVLSWAVIVLSVISFGFYIAGILRRSVVPKKSTWIIWLMLDCVIWVAKYLQHDVNTQIVVATIGSTIVLILTLKYGSSVWSIWDTWCLRGAIVGVLMILLVPPGIGLIFSLCVMLFGSWPLFEGLWNKKIRENCWAWIAQVAASACALFAIEQWTPMNVAQPLMFAFISVVVLFIMYADMASSSICDTYMRPERKE